MKKMLDTCVCASTWSKANSFQIDLNQKKESKKLRSNISENKVV